MANPRPLFVNEVISLYDSGFAIVPIAKQLGVGTQRVNKILKDAGKLRTRAEALSKAWDDGKMKPFPKRIGRVLDEQQVLNLFESGKTINEISADLKVSARRVRKLLTLHGAVEQTPSVRFCIGCKIELTDEHLHVKICRECAPNSRFYNLTMKYGVTRKIWEKMFNDQNGVCRLCDRDAAVVDHNHETGQVRGLLCHGCNSALGRIDADPAWAARAAEYSKSSLILEEFGS